MSERTEVAPAHATVETARTSPRIERLVQALLYEGYSLYPYRPSSLKNRKRWTFGTLEVGQGLETQVLVGGPAGARLAVQLRFLHLRGAAWQEVDERRFEAPEVALGALAAAPIELGAGWDADEAREQRGVRLRLELSARLVAPGGYRVTARASNVTPGEPESDQSNALAGVHVLLSIHGGEIVSLIDPPEVWAEAAAACRQQGVWPVLAGEPGDRSVALASPIILYDHPEVAPESPGDLFDATEIDEILTLRILTLTDDEKRELRATDSRARELLDRTEALGPESLRGLHGALRDPRAEGRRELRLGDRVRVRPKRRADVLDLVLEGKTATVEALERDLEGRLHVAVTVDEDPGRDMGEHAHRFFFAPDELERIRDRDEEAAP